MLFILVQRQTVVQVDCIMALWRYRLQMTMKTHTPNAITKNGEHQPPATSTMPTAIEPTPICPTHIISETQTKRRSRST